MGYGKLEVYWPGRDGLVESYRLEKSTVAIGRSTGNDIVLETTSVSRYHVSLSLQNNEIFLQDLDSANGTYVDGERLTPNTPVALQGGEEILIGDLRLIYIPDAEQEDSTTRSSRPPKTTTIRMETVQASFRIDLDPPTTPVTPGAHMQAVLLIDNLTTEMLRLSVEVEGIPADWVRVERTDLELDPGMQTTVGITFKPLRRSTTRPGNYMVTVRVRSQTAPDDKLEATMPLTVRSYSGFGIVLATPRITKEVPFELRVNNQGSDVLPITLTGSARGGGLIVAPSMATVELAAGENRTIQGYVRPQRERIIGPNRERRFDIVVRAQNASGFLAAVQGTFVERSWLPTWALGIIGVVGVLLIAVCLAVSVFLLRPRNAQIASFTVEPTPVYRNVLQRITLTWRVVNTRRVSIQTDGINLDVPIPDDVSGVNTLQLVGVIPGAATITLLAEGEDGDPVIDPRSLATIAPTCTAMQAVEIRSGPGIVFDPVASLTVGQVYPVDRRDPTTSWLRLEGASVWAPLTALNCTDFLPIDLVQIGAAEIPPTPTPTMIPTATVTATATVTVTPPPSSTPFPTLTSVPATVAPSPFSTLTAPG